MSSFQCVTVSTVEAGTKLFSFCRLKFPRLSKRQLHNLFMTSQISINGIPLTSGHDDEARRVCLGDVISYTDTADFSEHNDSKTFRRIAETPEGVAIIVKPAGEASRIGSTLDLAVKKSLWSGRYKSSSEFLYRSPKSQTGVCVVANNAETLSKLRQGLCLGTVRLRIRCICAGKVGNLGDSRLFTCDATKSFYEATVLRVVRSRSVDFLSELEVVPHFNPNCMCDCTMLSCTSKDSNTTGTVILDPHLKDVKVSSTQPQMHNGNHDHNRCIQYPTLCVKQLTRELARAGYPVVGDRDIVKSSKGLFASLVGVDMHRSHTSAMSATATTIATAGIDENYCSIDMKDSRERYIIDSPAKFSKLLQREEALWAKVASATNALLRSELNALTNNVDVRVCPDVFTGVGAGVGAGIDGGKGLREIDLTNDDDDDDDCGNDFDGMGDDGSTSDEDYKPMPCKKRRDGDGMIHDVTSLPVLSTPVFGDGIDIDIDSASSSIGTLKQSSIDIDIGTQPVEYQLGFANFFGCRFVVNNKVMIPRKSSETLVMSALNYLRKDWQPAVSLAAPSVSSPVAAPVSGPVAGPASDIQSQNMDVHVRVLDLGTGSGCLLLSLLAAMCKCSKHLCQCSDKSEGKGIYFMRVCL